MRMMAAARGTKGEELPNMGAESRSRGGAARLEYRWRFMHMFPPVSGLCKWKMNSAYTCIGGQRTSSPA